MHFVNYPPHPPFSTLVDDYPKVGSIPFGWAASPSGRIDNYLCRKAAIEAVR